MHAQFSSEITSHQQNYDTDLRFPFTYSKPKIKVQEKVQLQISTDGFHRHFHDSKIQTL